MASRSAGARNHRAPGARSPRRRQAARPAQQPQPVTLRIIFPEGFSGGWPIKPRGPAHRDRAAGRHATADALGTRPRSSARVLRTFAPDESGAALRDPLPRDVRVHSGDDRGDAGCESTRCLCEALAARRSRAAKRRGRTPYDVLEIASMIERETVAPEERRQSWR